MKACEKRIIAEAGMHPIHSHSYVLSLGLDHTRIVQLPGVNDGTGATDDLSNLGMGIKVA
ncbi:Uncharacterised protein [uncultured archaeon]|nr:Uncharacterised protein [uncultured archaeon]